MALKRVSILVYAYLLLAQQTIAAVVPLEASQINKIVSDLEEVYRFGHGVICTWGGGSHITEGDEWFEKYFKEKCQDKIKNCRIVPSNGIYLISNGKKYTVYFQNDPSYSSFKTFKIVHRLPTPEFYVYKEVDLLQAYFKKSDLPCEPYSISKYHFDNDVRVSKEIVTGTSSGVLTDKLNLTSQSKETNTKVTHDIGLLTDRTFEDCIDRLGITEDEIMNDKGSKYLSVGEGNSDFVSKLANKGIDSTAVDAELKNIHAPERSVIAFSQHLPFPDNTFKKTVSVWLIPHFFIGTINDPQAGKQAMQEMLRVTKVGGEVMINPVSLFEGGRWIIDYFDSLNQEAKSPVVSYVLTYKEKGHRKILTSTQIKNDKKLLETVLSASSGESGFGKPAKGAQTNSIKVTKLR